MTPREEAAYVDIARQWQAELYAAIDDLAAALERHDAGEPLVSATGKPPLDWERERVRLEQFRELERLAAQFLRTRTSEAWGEFAAAQRQVSRALGLDGVAGTAAQADEMFRGATEGGDA